MYVYVVRTCMRCGTNVYLGGTKRRWYMYEKTGNCDMVFYLKFSDAIKTLRLLSNQILFILKRRRFLWLVWGVADCLCTSITTSVKVLCLYSAVELQQVQISGGWQA